MPDSITLYDVGVWFAVGLFTGAGWVLGSMFMTWAVSRLIR